MGCVRIKQPTRTVKDRESHPHPSQRNPPEMNVPGGENRVPKKKTKKDRSQKKQSHILLNSLKKPTNGGLLQVAESTGNMTNAFFGGI